MTYTPIQYRSPFGHVRYAIALSEDCVTNYGAEHRYLEMPDWDHPHDAVTVHQDMQTYTHCLVLYDISKLGTINTLAEAIALITHEATHIYQFCRDAMREPKPSIEFEAYSIQQIVVDLLQHPLFVSEIQNVINRSGSLR